MWWWSTSKETISIHEAVKYYNLKAVREILTTNPEAANYLCEKGNTPLLNLLSTFPSNYFTLSGGLDYMKLLKNLELENTNIMNHMVFNTVKYNLLHIAKELINCPNTNLNARDSETGSTALYFVTKFCRDLYTIEHGYELLRDLINAKADINVKDNDGQTVVMTCLASNIRDILINAGADLTIHDNNQSNLAHYIEGRCPVDHSTLNYLRKTHPELFNVKNINGQTPTDIRNALDQSDLYYREKRRKQRIKILEKKIASLKAGQEEEDTDYYYSD